MKIPNRCVVGGCGNTPNLREGIAFPFIPFAEDDRLQARKRRKKWVDFLKLKRPTDSAICSKHFAAEDFVRMYSFMPGQDKPVIPRLQRDDIGITAFPKILPALGTHAFGWPTTVTAKANRQGQITHGKRK